MMKKKNTNKIKPSDYTVSNAILYALHLCHFSLNSASFGLRIKVILSMVNISCTMSIHLAGWVAQVGANFLLSLSSHANNNILTKY